jgi:hypothetical protein
MQAASMFWGAAAVQPAACRPAHQGWSDAQCYVLQPLRGFCSPAGGAAGHLLGPCLAVAGISLQGSEHQRCCQHSAVSQLTVLGTNQLQVVGGHSMDTTHMRLTATRASTTV